MTRNDNKQGLQKKRAALLIEIERLKREVEQREKQLPAHSVRPHQILAIEKLENKIRQKKDQIQDVEEKLLRSQDAKTS